MNNRSKTTKIMLSGALTALLMSTTLMTNVSAAETIDTRVGKIEFQKSGYPTEASIEKLHNEMDFQRATQLYMWAVPLVGVTETVKAYREVQGFEDGQQAYFITRAQKQGIITANFTTPYVISAWSLAKTGPTVLELPAGKMAGMLLDVHQRILSDLSLLGPDKGKGGKYLIVPPGHEEIKAEGYHVIHSPSNYVFTGLRIIEPNISKAEKELLPGIKTYAYNDGKLGKVKPVVPSTEEKWSTIPKKGMAYWEAVNMWLQEEHAIEERDRFMVAYLKGLGMEKGKDFNPTDAQKKILLEAAKVGRAMTQANDYKKRFAEPYWPGTSWKDAIAVETDQNTEHYEQIDERAAWFWEAITVSRGMKSTIPGFGQRYMVTYTDADGGYLSGEHTYKLNVPANVPASNFWAMTIYSEEYRCLIENDTGSPEISSRKKNLKVNSDGSIDVYMGPKPVKGFENNWIQTMPGEGWFPYFRFYGPTEKMFNKEWTMGDIELVK